MADFNNNNHLLIQLFASVAFALLFACTPGGNPGGNDDNGGNKEVAATAIKLNKNELTLEKGSNETLTVTFTPSNVTNKSLTWVSSNESIVKVTDGIVVAVDAGSTEVVVKHGDLTDRCTVTVVISVKGLSLNKDKVELVIGETETLMANIEPSNTTDKVVWTSSDEEVVTVQEGTITAKTTGSATITVTVGSLFATCEVLVKKEVPEGAVDLGLSVFWAKCNLGAKKPEDYGDYYAWGEIDPYNDGTPYKFFNDQGITKYCPDDKTGSWGGEGAPDGKTVLDAADDAAYILLGGSWRMPTYDEVSELTKKCKVEWTSEKGVYGFRFTSRVNGNSIFLPAAGYWELTDLYADGIMGRYWSSSLDTGSGPSYEAGPRFAWSLAFNDDSNNAATHRQFRSLGLSIRPVSE